MTKNNRLGILLLTLVTFAYLMVLAYKYVPDFLRQRLDFIELMGVYLMFFMFGVTVMFRLLGTLYKLFNSLFSDGPKKPDAP